MNTVATTKMSSKGQIVIPEEFKEIILRARQAAYESEMKPEDILEAIKETRSER